LAHQPRASASGVGVSIQSPATIDNPKIKRLNIGSSHLQCFTFVIDL
jgi:hypothetical protein